jgi:hypothetical protein
VKTKISLMLLNENGCVATIENNEDMDSLTLATSNTSRCGKSMCLKAAKKLRGLADAFERLAKSEQPFTEEAQRKAMRQ